MCRVATDNPPTTHKPSINLDSSSKGVLHISTEDIANTYSFYRTRLEGRLKSHVWVLKELFDITLKGGLKENSNSVRKVRFQYTRKCDSMRQEG